MKKKLLIIVLASTLLLLSGCRMYPFHLIQKINHGNGSHASSTYNYTDKDGQEVHHLVMEEDGTVQVQFISRTGKGTVHVQILDEDGEALIDIEGRKFSMEETLTLGEGSYQVVFNYDRAKDGRMIVDFFSKSHLEYDNEDDVDEEKPEKD